MLTRCLVWLRRRVQRGVGAMRTRARQWTKPRSVALATGLAGDLPRSRGDFLLENALLRQQILVLHRAARRSRFTPLERGLLVLLASRLRTWASALLILQPETLLRWHRQGFRLFWRRKSAPRSRPSPLPTTTIDLLRRMARDNPLWGAERIRGELLKLDPRVSKRTVQKYLARDHSPRPSGQPWATFLRNHAYETWACDFLPVTDLPFRPLFAFFLVELGSRRVAHVGVTRHPTDAWVALQLREATPFGERPHGLIRDNDRKYGACFDRLTAASGIRVLARPSAPCGPTPPASASSGACAASVWITCSSSASATSPACCASTSPTSTGHGRTKGSGSVYPTPRPRREPANAAARWWRVPFSAGCTMTIGAPPERAAP